MLRILGAVGMTIEGTVKRIAKRGAFIELKSSAQGLLSQRLIPAHLQLKPGMKLVVTIVEVKKVNNSNQYFLKYGDNIGEN